MSDSHEIRFRANPVQQAFIQSRASADLFSSRMGEGKSAGLCWSIFYHTQRNGGADWLMIRDTWESLRATTQREFFTWFPPGIFGNYKVSEKLFEWTLDGVDGSVRFLGLDDPRDASRLQSMSIAGFAMDEPSPAAGTGGISQFIFETAMSRLRQPKMNWYAAKLAQNNSDRSHWTYRLFVDPGTPGYKSWQTRAPENTHHLPPNYYPNLDRLWQDRPDLRARFVKGEFGFQKLGRDVTPEWSDAIHLAQTPLKPIRACPVHCLWDGGLNPTCLMTQITPLGYWQFFKSFVGDGIGIIQLIEDEVRPYIAAELRNFELRHIGDPSMVSREASDSRNSAVRAIRSTIGGPWRSGPQSIDSRVDPLRAVLRKTLQGVGLVRVCAQNAGHVHRALQGGWHHHISREGVVSPEPVKNEHSHPGDAAGYGAAVLFPLGKAMKAAADFKNPEPPSYFRPSIYGNAGGRFDVPKEGRTIEERKI